MMFKITSALQTQFEVCLRNKGIPEKTYGLYKKWLRYYLDFCQKYNFPQKQKESLPHFLKKLQEKRQTKAQQEQAVHAIALYYELLDTKDSVPTPNPSQEGKELTIDNWQLSIVNSRASSQEGNVVAAARRNSLSSRVKTREESAHHPGLSHMKAQSSPTVSSPPEPPSAERASAEPPDKKDSLSHQTKTGKGASWKAEYGRLAEALQSRGYAPTTSKKYTRWVRKFQAFTRSKPPELLSSTDVREFLESLTMKRRMTLSSLNQVFDASAPRESFASALQSRERFLLNHLRKPVLLLSA